MMSKKMIAIISLLVLSSWVSAGELRLTRADAGVFTQYKSKVAEYIAKDNTKLFIDSIDQDQSFNINGKANQLIGTAIPVVYNSKQYKNNICRLYVFDPKGRVKKIDLMAEQGNEDEVVSSCVSIDAVSLLNLPTGISYYLAITNNTVVNNNHSKASVVRIENNNFSPASELSACVNDAGDIESILQLKKQLNHCIKK